MYEPVSKIVSRSRLSKVRTHREQTQIHRETDR